MTCDAKGLGDINTALGQNLTDDVIEILFDRISKGLRNTDIFSTAFRRQAGGDEGIFILPGVRDLEGLAAVFNRLQGEIRRPVVLTISKVEADNLLERHGRLCHELSQNGDKKKKVAGAVKVLGPIVHQIQSAPPDEDSYEIFFDVNMRFAALNLTPGKFKKGFIRDARNLLELLEEAAKEAEELHVNPCVAYEPESRSAHLISSSSVDALSEGSSPADGLIPQSNSSKYHHVIANSYSDSFVGPLRR